MNYRLVFFFVILLVPGLLFGQPGDPGGDPDVPITGIEYLLGAGALFGAWRKFFSSKKRSSE